MQNLHLDNPASQIEKRRRTTLPYTALDVRCPMCATYCGKRCRSSKRTLLRYPHFQRIELAAERFRAEARLRILEGIRRHPFASAFSPRRLAEADCFVVRSPKERAGDVGGRGTLDQERRTNAA
jgi:hypothetical protein